MTPDTHELVDCNVQVTLALARRIREQSSAGHDLG